MFQNISLTGSPHIHPEDYSFLVLYALQIIEYIGYVVYNMLVNRIHGVLWIISKE